MMIDVRELRIQLDDLYRQCVEKKPAFDALVTRLAEQTGSKTLLVPLKLAAKEKAHGLYEEKRQLLAGKRTNKQLSTDQKRRMRDLDRQMRMIYREAE